MKLLRISLLLVHCMASSSSVINQTDQWANTVYSYLQGAEGVNKSTTGWATKMSADKEFEKAELCIKLQYCSSISSITVNVGYQSFGLKEVNTYYSNGQKGGKTQELIQSTFDKPIDNQIDLPQNLNTNFVKMYFTSNYGDSYRGYVKDIQVDGTQTQSKNCEPSGSDVITMYKDMATTWTFDISSYFDDCIISQGLSQNSVTLVLEADGDSKDWSNVTITNSIENYQITLDFKKTEIQSGQVKFKYEIEGTYINPKKTYYSKKIHLTVLQNRCQDLRLFNCIVNPTRELEFQGGKNVTFDMKQLMEPPTGCNYSSTANLTFSPAYLLNVTAQNASEIQVNTSKTLGRTIMDINMVENQLQTRPCQFYLTLFSMSQFACVSNSNTSLVYQPSQEVDLDLQKLMVRPKGVSWPYNYTVNLRSKSIVSSYITNSNHMNLKMAAKGQVDILSDLTIHYRNVTTPTCQFKITLCDLSVYTCRKDLNNRLNYSAEFISFDPRNYIAAPTGCGFEDNYLLNFSPSNVLKIATTQTKFGIFNVSTDPSMYTETPLNFTLTKEGIISPTCNLTVRKIDANITSIEPPAVQLVNKQIDYDAVRTSEMNAEFWKQKPHKKTNHFGMLLEDRLQKLEICSMKFSSGSEYIKYFKLTDYNSSEQTTGNQSGTVCKTYLFESTDCINKIVVKSTAFIMNVQFNSIDGRNINVGHSSYYFHSKTFNIGGCMTGIYGQLDSQYFATLGFFYTPKFPPIFLNDSKSLSQTIYTKPDKILGKVNYDEFKTLAVRKGYDYPNLVHSKVGGKNSTGLCDFKHMDDNNPQNVTFFDFAPFSDELNHINETDLNLMYLGDEKGSKFAGKVCSDSFDSGKLNKIMPIKKYCESSGNFFLVQDGECKYTFDGTTSVHIHRNEHTGQASQGRRLEETEKLGNGFWFFYSSKEKTCLGKYSYSIYLKGVCSNEEKTYKVQHQTDCSTQIIKYSKSACYYFNVDLRYYNAYFLINNIIALTVIFSLMITFIVYSVRGDFYCSVGSGILLVLEFFAIIILQLYEPKQGNLEFLGIFYICFSAFQVFLVVNLVKLICFQIRSDKAERFSEQKYHKQQFLFSLLRLVLAITGAILIPYALGNINLEAPVFERERVESVLNWASKPKYILGMIGGLAFCIQLSNFIIDTCAIKIEKPVKIKKHEFTEDEKQYSDSYGQDKLKIGLYDHAIEEQYHEGLVALGLGDMPSAIWHFTKDKNPFRGRLHTQRMLKQVKEHKEFESKNFKLPDWYKNWLLANQVSMRDRPPEYVHFAIDIREELLKIVGNKEWFILHNPETTLLECQGLVDKAIQTYQLMVQKRKKRDATIHRYLGLGVPGQKISFEDFNSWDEEQEGYLGQLRREQIGLKKQLADGQDQVVVGVDKNKEGNQLDACVKDINNFWAIVNIKNCLGSSIDQIGRIEFIDNQYLDSQIHINSSGTTFNRSLKSRDVKDKIRDEFQFFTAEYFKYRKEAFITVYLTGAGKIRYIPFYSSMLGYDIFLDNVLTCADNQNGQIGVLNEQDILEQTIEARQESFFTAGPENQIQVSKDDYFDETPDYSQDDIYSREDAMTKARTTLMNQSSSNKKLLDSVNEQDKSIESLKKNISITPFEGDQEANQESEKDEEQKEEKATGSFTGSFCRKLIILLSFITTMFVDYLEYDIQFSHCRSFPTDHYQDFRTSILAFKGVYTKENLTAANEFRWCDKDHNKYLNKTEVVDCIDDSLTGIKLNEAKNYKLQMWLTCNYQKEFTQSQLSECFEEAKINSTSNLKFKQDMINKEKLNKLNPHKCTFDHGFYISCGIQVALILLLTIGVLQALGLPINCVCCNKFRIYYNFVFDDISRGLFLIYLALHFLDISNKITLSIFLPINLGCALLNILVGCCSYDVQAEKRLQYEIKELVFNDGLEKVQVEQEPEQKDDLESVCSTQKNIFDHEEAHAEEERICEWNFNLYIDSSFSGSAIDEAMKWLEHHAEKIKDKKEEDSFKYFKNPGKLKFKILTACSSNEIANDSGTGHGGLWSNNYLAENIFDQNEENQRPNQEPLFAESWDDKEIKQTPQKYVFSVVQVKN